jgi:hypothetical protein
MCRNIRILFNFEPPATEEEIQAASLQFVRKISGFNKPSRTNEAAFNEAVGDIASIAARLLGSLESSGTPRNREEEAAKARARAAERFGK